MTLRTYLIVTAMVFTLVFLVHALRLVYGWPAMIGGWSVPAWVSWLGLLVSGFLAYQGVRLRK